MPAMQVMLGCSFCYVGCVSRILAVSLLFLYSRLRSSPVSIVTSGLVIIAYRYQIDNQKHLCYMLWHRKDLHSQVKIEGDTAL